METWGDYPRIEVKAVFLLLQCLECTLPLGRCLQVAPREGLWIISAEGRRLRTGLAAWEALVGPATDSPIDSSVVQFALLKGLLSKLGLSLTLSETFGRIEARF